MLNCILCKSERYHTRFIVKNTVPEGSSLTWGLILMSLIVVHLEKKKLSVALNNAGRNATRSWRVLLTFGQGFLGNDVLASRMTRSAQTLCPGLVTTHVTWEMGGGSLYCRQK